MVFFYNQLFYAEVIKAQKTMDMYCCNSRHTQSLSRKVVQGNT